MNKYSNSFSLQLRRRRSQHFFKRPPPHPTPAFQTGFNSFIRSRKSRNKHAEEEPRVAVGAVSARHSPITRSLSAPTTTSCSSAENSSFPEVDLTSNVLPRALNPLDPEGGNTQSEQGPAPISLAQRFLFAFLSLRCELFIFHHFLLRDEYIRPVVCLFVENS